MKILIQSKRGQAYVKPVVVVAFLVGLCLSGISTQADVIRDDFVGAVDTPLKDTYTPTGHAQWIALRDTDFMYDGNCLKVGAINEEAYVNFTSNAIVRMQGAMQVSSTGNWLAMKMGGTTTYPVSGNGIAVMLGTTGNFDMYVNTTVVMSIYSNAYTYNTTGFNTYAMEYNGFTGQLNP
ncbi:MAG: hypothetical protein WCQ90_15120, partial [Deltaproteobacteria bacterium]